MDDHVETIVCSSETDQIMLHVGTNYLVTDKTLMQICNDIISLAAFIEVNGIKVAISLIVPRNDGLIERAKTVNASLINICKSIGVNMKTFDLISHGGVILVFIREGISCHVLNVTLASVTIKCLIF